jgi:hypothetical protein
MVETMEMSLADAERATLVEDELKTHNVEAPINVLRHVYLDFHPDKSPEKMITKYLRQKLSDRSQAAFTARRKEVMSIIHQDISDLLEDPPIAGKPPIGNPDALWYRLPDNKYLMLLPSTVHSPDANWTWEKDIPMS